MKIRQFILTTIIGAGCLLHSNEASAQSKLYPQHFDLSEVELLDSPFKTAMLKNAELLLKYDADRLMTPFIRQAGLDKAGSKYQGWVSATLRSPTGD